jgi:bifunctional DNase/RNase
MSKIQLMVLGLSASPASNNAYALILKEVDGERRLPIIIGAFEAQAIALEMEGVVPPRPMTHDLMKKVIDAFGSNLTEVFINDLSDGTFYAKLLFDSSDIEIDARPSDAIALAVRFNAPIYVNNDILEETGILPQAEEQEPEEPVDSHIKFMGQTPDEEEEQPGAPHQPEGSKMERLQRMLDKAIMEEDYEKAAKIRDEMNKLSS